MTKFHLKKLNNRHFQKPGIKRKGVGAGGRVVVSDLKSNVVIKLVDTECVDVDGSRYVGEEEENHDRDGDQHLHPFLPVLQHGQHPPLRPDLRVL